jgi:hypothetical protein
VSRIDELKRLVNDVSLYGMDTSEGRLPERDFLDIEADILKLFDDSYSVTVLPTTPAQYLFGGDNTDLELWKLTTSGWFDASGTHYDSPTKRNPKLTRWRRAVL